MRSARLDRTAQAQRELEALAHADFCDLPRDVGWLPNLTALCEVVVILGDARRAQLLYKLLLPYANRCVVIFGQLSLGSVSRPLGLLATTLSRYDDAELHFENALTMNAQSRFAALDRPHPVRLRSHAPRAQPSRRRRQGTTTPHAGAHHGARARIEGARRQGATAEAQR